MCKIVVCLLALLLVAVSNALHCWECTGASTDYECNQSGSLELCLGNEQSCETHVRTDDVGGVVIDKMCKQGKACKNNELQNNRPAMYPVQCNIYQTNAVCRCCCNTEGCNENSLQCINDVSYPKGHCNAKDWVLDLVIVVDSSSSVGTTNWRKQMDLVKLIASSYNIGRNKVRVGVFRYNKVVDTKSEIALIDTSTAGDLMNKIDRFPYDGRGTKTGKALNHAFYTSLSPARGNRPDVPDVVLVITDGKSYDDVKVISDEMRLSGVQLHAIGIGMKKNSFKTIIEIAGSNAMSLDKDFTTSDIAAADFNFHLAKKFCEKDPCTKLGDIFHGTIDCSDGSNVRSVCTFNCEPGFTVKPPTLTSTTCQPNQNWTNPIPCCLPENCDALPPTDIIFIIDSSSSFNTEEWNQQIAFVQTLVKKHNVGINNDRIGIFRFNKEVDTVSEVKLKDTTNLDDLLIKIGKIPHNGDGTKTGRALTYAYEHALTAEFGNRPEARDIVIVITDGKAYDDVRVPSKNLRKTGVSVLCIGIGLTTPGELRTLQQVTGGRKNFAIKIDNFADLVRRVDEIETRINRVICNVCPEMKYSN